MDARRRWRVARRRDGRRSALARLSALGRPARGAGEHAAGEHLSRPGRGASRRPGAPAPGRIRVGEEPHRRSFVDELSLGAAPRGRTMELSATRGTHGRMDRRARGRDRRERLHAGRRARACSTPPRPRSMSRPASIQASSSALRSSTLTIWCSAATRSTAAERRCGWARWGYGRSAPGSARKASSVRSPRRGSPRARPAASAHFSASGRITSACAMRSSRKCRRSPVATSTASRRVS